MVDEAVGCGPEAEAAEAFGDMFEMFMDTCPTGIAPATRDALQQWVWKQIGDGYAKGYAQANADRALAETEHLADEKWP